MQKSEIFTPEDERLALYLLGMLPEAEAEAFDELSVTDDEFAAHLSAVEHDIIDAWVRGELPDDLGTQFDKRLAASARGSESIAFAKTLVSYETRNRFSGTERRMPQWLLLAAAVAIILVSGYLVLNSRARSAGSGVPVAESLTEELQTPLATSTSTAPQIAEKEIPAQSPVPGATPSVIAPAAAAAVLLSPQTRSGSSVPVISVSPGTDTVSARVLLEFDDFPAYEVALEDPATSRVLWKSESLRAEAAGARRTVLVRMPAPLLEERSYSLELFGKRSDGMKEFVGNYVFRAVLE